MLLILVFSLMMGWFPVTGRIDLLIPFQRITGIFTLDSILTSNWDALKSSVMHLILPAFALSLETTGTIARMIRSSMLEVLNKDYITTAKAVGFPNRTVFLKYGLKNALIPTVTVVGLKLRGILAGAVLTETVFAWPGVGQLTIKAIMFRDYPLIVGCVTVLIIGVAVINLIVDLVYSYLDPRIRY
jgi:peptide/nickel transport system permease protein